MVLSGAKTIESRFSRNRCAPDDKIGDGDIILLKEVAGPIHGHALAGRIWCFDLLTEAIDRIRHRFGAGIGADDQFWASRADGSARLDLVAIPLNDVRLQMSLLLCFSGQIGRGKILG
jgi:hypothetical protein